MPSKEVNPNLDIKAGPQRWIAHLCGILLFQCVLYGSIAVSVYSIVTLNWQMMIAIAVQVLLQSFLTMSPTYVRLVQKYIYPLWYFKRFQRIYDEPEFEEEHTMFCFHPHSVFSYCIVSQLHADGSRMSRMVGLGSRFILSLPIFSAILRLWGVQGVDPNHLKVLMRDKKVPVGLVPGGYEEATLTSPNQIKIYIKERKGFIKYALKYGYAIRPTLVYNEHKAFWTFQGLEKLRLVLNKIKLPGVIFGGGFLWVFLPLNLEMVTIVGRGLSRKPENIGKSISVEEIDEMHSEYIEEIKRLHNKYKTQFNEAELVFY